MAVVEKISILQVTNIRPRSWMRVTIKLILQATPETNENMVEVIKIGEGKKLRLMVEGRKPRCYKCGHLDHFQFDCLPSPAAEIPVRQDGERTTSADKSGSTEREKLIMGKGNSQKGKKELTR